MKLLTIGTVNNFIKGFENRLIFELDFLKAEGIQIILKKLKSNYVDYYHFYIDDDILLERNYFNILRHFYFCIADVISDIVIDFFETKLLKRSIKSNYFYFTPKEQKKIYYHAKKIIGCNSERKNLIFHEVLNYVEENSVLIIEGFTNFRLQKYIQLVEDAVDDGVDLYLIEKDHEEFLKMLQLFVEQQPSKCDLVNVVLKNGELRLYDEEAEPLKIDEFLLAIAKNNASISIDDIIISTLINLSPQKIVLHGFCGSEKHEAISVICGIFQEKVVYCKYCNLILDINIEPIKTK